MEELKYANLLKTLIIWRIYGNFVVILDNPQIK